MHTHPCSLRAATKCSPGEKRGLFVVTARYFFPWLFPNAISSAQKPFSSPGLNDLFFFSLLCPTRMPVYAAPAPHSSLKTVYIFYLKIFFGCRGSSFPPGGIFHCGLRAQLLPGMCELSSPTRDQTCLPSLQGEFLTNGSLEKSYIFYFLVGLTRSNVPKGSPPHPEPGTVALIDAGLIKQKEVSRIPVLTTKPARPAPGGPLWSPKRPKLSHNAAPTLPPVQRSQYRY